MQNKNTKKTKRKLSLKVEQLDNRANLSHGMNGGGNSMCHQAHDGRDIPGPSVAWY